TLARRLRVMYRVHAQGGALPLILSGDDPVTRAVAVRHLASLAALDARLIREYRGTSERLADRKGREEARRLEAFISELQARQRKLARVPPPKGGVEPPGVGFGNLRGRLPWPAEGRIVTTFGAQVPPRFGTR